MNLYKPSILHLMILIITSSFLFGCGKGKKDDEDAEARKITIAPSTVNPIVGGELTLSVTLDYSDLTVETITNKISWDVDNNEILTLSDEKVTTATDRAVATCVSEGKATIVATFEEFSDEISIFCNEKPTVNKIYAWDFGNNLPISSGATININENASVFLELRAQMSDTDPDNPEIKNLDLAHTFVFSDDSKASINNSTLTGLQHGTTTLTITANEEQANDIPVSAEPFILTVNVAPIPVSVIVETPFGTAPNENNEEIVYRLNVGDETSIVSQAILSNGNQKNISSQIAWVKGVPGIVDIFDTSLKALAPGSTNIHFSYFPKPGSDENIRSEDIRVWIEKPLELFVEDDSNNELSLIWNEQFDIENYALQWKQSDQDIFSDPIIVTGNKYQVPSADIADKSKTYEFRVAYKVDGNGEYFDYTEAISVKPHQIKWTQQNNFPPYINGSSISVEDNIYLLGGQKTKLDGSAETSNEIWKFDTLTGLWSKTSESLTQPRENAAVCELNGQVYMFGGLDRNAEAGPELLSSVAVINSTSGFELNVIANEFTFPPIQGAACTSDGINKIYLSGGQSGTQIEDIIYSFTTTVTSETATITQDATTNTLFRPRQQHKSIVANDILFIIGGAIPDNEAFIATDTMESYALTDLSVMLSGNVRMDIARYNFDIMLTNDNLYVIGGYDGSDNLVSQTQYLNLLDTNAAWVNDNIIPFDSSPFFSQYNLKNRTYYFFGGIFENNPPANGSPAATGFTSNDVTIKWQPLLNASKNISKTSGGIIGDTIFLFGGKTTDNRTTNKTQAFSLSSNSWVTDTRGPDDLTIARTDVATVSVNNMIFAIGGLGSSNNHLSHVEIYNQDSNAIWSSLDAQLLTPRSNACAVEHNGYLYVIGGENRSGLVDTIERYGKVIPGIDQSEWIEVAKLDQGVAGMSCVTLNDSIYIIGGYTETITKTATRLVYQLNIKNGTYKIEDKTALDTARINPAVSVLNNRIYVFGGANSNEIDSATGLMTSELSSYSDNSGDVGLGWDIDSIPKFPSGIPSNNPYSTVVDNKIILIASHYNSIADPDRVYNNTSQILILE